MKHILHLSPSTTLAPTKFRKPQHIHEHNKLCLSKEAAQHFYHAVQINEPITPFYINPHKAAKPTSHVTPKEPSKAALQPEMESNPYAQALNDNIDCHFCKDPMNKGQLTELLWSLLSTEVIYTSHTTNTSPYSNIHSERLYDCLDLSEINYPTVLNEDCSDRLEEVQSTLKISTHFEGTSVVSTTYMGKLCPMGRDFKFENQLLLVVIAPHREL